MWPSSGAPTSNKSLICLLSHPLEVYREVLFRAQKLAVMQPQPYTERFETCAVHMYEFIDTLRGNLLREGFVIAENHLRQAVENIAAGNHEAASGQLRSFAEGFFDKLHVLLIGTGLTRGAARRDLVERGKLTQEEGALLKATIEVLHGEGAHAGRLDPNSSVARLFVCAGVVHSSIALVPRLPTVHEVLKLAPINTPAGHRLPTDAEMRTSCPSCNHHQSLADATLRRGDEYSEYVCVNGCQVILIIGRPGESPWEGRGYRLGDYVIRNAKDVIVPIIPVDFIDPGGISALKGIVINASPAALMRRQPAV
jgi:hypothetical protein